jgi:hypothetical protein
MNTETKTTIDDANLLVERYIAVWNERDAAHRRALITQLWTDDASYLDPLMQGEGHSGIDTMIQGVQERFVGHHFRQRDKVDTHNNHMRFSWDLVSEGGDALAGGTDFATVAADGRLQTVVGFLDFVPATNG